MKKKTLLQSSGFVTLFASLVCIAIGLLFGFLVLLLLGGAISEKELEEKIRNVGIDEIRTLARSFSSLSDACICAVGKTAGTKFYNKVVSAGK